VVVLVFRRYWRCCCGNPALNSKQFQLVFCGYAVYISIEVFTQFGMCWFVVFTVPFIYLCGATSVNFVYPWVIWKWNWVFGTYLHRRWRGAVLPGPVEKLRPGGPEEKPLAAGGKPQRKRYPFFRANLMGILFFGVVLESRLSSRTFIIFPYFPGFSTPIPQ